MRHSVRFRTVLDFKPRNKGEIMHLALLVDLPVIQEVDSGIGVWDPFSATSLINR